MKTRIFLLLGIFFLLGNCSSTQTTVLEQIKLKKESVEKSSTFSQDLKRNLSHKGVEVKNDELICFSSFEDEFSSSYLQIGKKCEEGSSLCLGFNGTFRSWCQKDKKSLVYYECDLMKKDLISIKEKECEKSCVSGACIE